MQVIVVGAGIGGLTAAVALSRRGHAVTLIDRAPAFEAIGAGLLMAPNAVHALASLGIDLDGVGVPLDTLDLADAGGRVLGSVNLGRLAREFGPSFGITRPALHESILRALPDSVSVHLGHAVDAIASSVKDRVTVHSGDLTWEADLVVGADGLHSRIREIACGPQTLRYAGETCWRGIVPLAVGHRAVEQWGDGTRVGVFPMTADTAYYYLLRCVPQGAPPPAWDELRTHFTAYRGLAGEAIAAIGDVPPLHHDLLELDRPVWGAERVLLLGDAAHAMTPNVGQGAAMAIEDAITLARVLDDGIDGALARHRTLREPRVRSVQLLARRAGLGVKVRGAWATRMRDSMMRAAPSQATERTWRAMIAEGVDLVARVN
ncbi:MAG: FAD-dependent oxidoreductase [Dermatophilaceae bacterium]